MASIRKAELERIAAERLASSKLAERDARIALFKAIAGCVGWCLIGIVMLGLAFHTGDERTGWVYFWGGLAIGYAGIFWTLHSYYRSGVERGDWL